MTDDNDGERRERRSGAEQRTETDSERRERRSGAEQRTETDSERRERRSGAEQRTGTNIVGLHGQPVSMPLRVNPAVLDICYHVTRLAELGKVQQIAVAMIDGDDVCDSFMSGNRAMLLLSTEYMKAEIMGSIGMKESKMPETENGIENVDTKTVGNKHVDEFHGIGWAVKQLHHGVKVRRFGWNGRGMWLILVSPQVSEGEYFSVPTPNGRFGFASVVTPGPYVGMKTADNKFVPWLCSQTDLLAVDWEAAE